MLPVADTACVWKVQFSRRGAAGEIEIMEEDNHDTA
jgi:hypothetical protein